MSSANTEPDDAARYRGREAELLRTSDILRMLPSGCNSALDVGARDGHFSKLLADRIPAVTALDLEVPRIDHPRVHCIPGDVTHLQFADAAFDLVVCTEVLEHIDPLGLPKACAELARVTRRHLLVGVPYRQDTRVGRTTCRGCGTHNPPWGHRSTLDEHRLHGLFPGLRTVEESYVGRNRETTNGLSRVLLDLAGNPYGTYGQEECCIGCGGALHEPPVRNLPQKVLTKAGHLARRLTERFQAERPTWIHLLFEKPSIPGSAAWAKAVVSPPATGSSLARS